MQIMLATISLATKFRSHDKIMLLYHSQAGIRESVEDGSLMDPLMKPTLFFTHKAISISRD